MEDKMDVITLEGEDGESIDFEIAETVKIAGTDYFLLVEAGDISADGRSEEDRECVILKDVSEPEAEEAVLEIVEDEKECDAVKKYFRDICEIEIE